jgi:PAS domain S-box-containing protein
MHKVGNSRVAWLRRCSLTLRDRFEIRLAALAGVLIVAVCLVPGFGTWRHGAASSAVLLADMSALGVAIGLGACCVAAVRRRELARAKAAGRWQQVFEQTDRGVAIASVDGLALQINRAYAQMHGYRADELIGQPLTVVLPDGGSGDWVEAIALTHKNGRHRSEALHRHRDGHLFPVVTELSTFLSGEGDEPGLLVELRDLGSVERSEAYIARDFFRKTFVEAPVGMMVTDGDGRYLRVNRALCEFTGYAERELLSMRYGDLTHPDDATRENLAAQTPVNSRHQSFQIEKRFRRKDGSEAWALAVVLRAFDDRGQLLYRAGQVIDIDKLKQAELDLRISEQRFRGVFENANTGIVIADQSGRVIHFNEAFSRMLGHDADVLRQMHFADFYVPAERSAETPLADEILRTPQDRYRIERRWVASDGRHVWVDLYISTIRDESGTIVNFIAVVGDITERKKSALALGESKRKLRALAAYQEELLEQERKHIAGEVHDEMGQLMTALKMDLSLMRLRFGENPQLLGMIDEMRSLVDRTINVVRQVASNLRPAVLDHGLAPAIEWLAADFSKRGTIRCRIDVSGSFALPELQSTAVFRVVQESLTNVTRHAQAREVTISLHSSGQQLQVVVRDDGVGFDTAAVSKGRGFGLFGMRERLLALGGRLRIASAPGQGTTVIIKLPLVNGEPS